MMDATEMRRRFKISVEKNVSFFITENDVMKADPPIYHIDRVIKETGKLFKDEAHIIYVNSQITRIQQGGSTSKLTRSGR